MFKFLFKLQRKYLFYVVIFIAVLSQGINAQVTVNLELPPPYKFKIENLWKLILTNPSAQLNVYLLGTVVRKRDNKLIAEATTSTFILPNGVKRVNSADISPVDLKKYDDDLDKTLDRFGTFPDGEYTICVYVYSAENNTELGSDCADISVLTLTQPELLSPTNKEIVRSACI